MFRTIFAGMLILVGAPAAFGHFVFVVPAADGKTLHVFFSETLDEDAAVSLGPVAGLKLKARTADGKDSDIALKPHDHHLSGLLPGRPLIYGSLDYGVMTRGSQSFMLKYHPKSIIGYLPGDRSKLGAPAEIVPESTAAGVKFRVLQSDRPAAKVDVTVLVPDGSAKKVTTDADGRTEAFALPGRYGAWARVVEDVTGEYQGQKYTQVRHYPTLVAMHSPYPPMPEAVSSFGAAVAGDWVYSYGGHRAKVHSYDKVAVTGGWRRIHLAKPDKWEELAPGMPLQGLALVAHAGKLYRLGGMAPLNEVGAKVDHRSTENCAVFDPATNKWTDIAPLPKPRSSHDAVVIGDTIYVVGGWNMRGSDGNDWFDDVLTLDLKNPTAAWQTQQQPFRRRALQAAVHQGKVYVIGGLNENGGVEDAVEILDPSSGQWTKGPDLIGGDHAGFSPGACALADRLYVSTADGAVLRMSGDGSKWEEVAKIAPRIVHRMVPAGENKLLLLGGAARGVNLDWAEVVPVK